MTKQQVSNAVLLIAGNFILALSVGMFILPFNILSGGVAGIAIALEPLTTIPAKLMIDFLVIGLFIIGSLFLGKKFAINTAISSFLYPFFLTFTSTFDPNLTLDPLLASLYGGLLAGIGVGMVIRTGASTGGMDVPPLVIHKFTGLELAMLVLVVDGLTVLLGLWSFGLEAVLIGFISVWACAFALDKVLVFGGQEAKTVHIISPHYAQISKLIHERLDRGTTLLNATGGFTGDSRPVLLAVILKNQYPELAKLVNEVDKEAFIIVSEATEVHGFGFSFDYKV
ncbi:MAG TPA: YitT family protein [Erysipelotrichaceae bacterium]|nr:YitT family protein [Erysipelotrichaceae bacterium]